ncbi:MAG: hypothetical protein HYZ53_13845 [Planctomycetes bacterium]|nr:hypothetical protein [Planctomycetota bacterium]
MSTAPTATPLPGGGTSAHSTPPAQAAGRGIRRALARTRRRWLAVKRGEGLLLLSVFVSAAVLVCFLLDNFLHLGALPRLALTVLFAAGVLYVTGRHLFPFLVSAPTDEEVALLIERGTPGFDNRLINAIQLEGAALEPAAASFAGLLLEDAGRFLQSVDLGAAVSHDGLRKFARLLPVPLAALLVYGLAFPASFRNALQRYTHPSSFVAPLTRTTLLVQPGHARVLRGDRLVVQALTGGEQPPGATLRTWARDQNTAQEMTFTGAGFSFAFDKVSDSFEYRVDAGDAESERFRVTALDRPRVVSIALEFRYPEYTRLPPKTEDPATGEIVALIGTRVRLTARANRPLAKAAIVLSDGAVLPARDLAGERFSVELVVERKDRFRFQVEDVDGFTDKDRPSYSILALEDRPPTVELREPGRNVTLPPAGELSVSVRAKDDFGLVSVTLHGSREGSQEDIPLAVWTAFERDREVNTGFLLRLAPLALKPGDILRYVARARDTKGQETASRTFAIAVAGPQEEKAKLLEGLSAVLDRLRKLLEDQKRARAGVEQLRKLAGARPERIARDGKPVQDLQVSIREAALKLLADWNDPVLARMAVRERLAALAEDEMAKVLTPLAALRTARDAPTRTAQADATLALQARILAILQELLADAKSVLEDLKQGDAEQVIAAQESTGTRDKLKEMLDKLKEFAKAQQKVIEASQELSKKKPDDFTSEDKKELADLKATEEKWGKFLEEAGTDLSKVSPQDFSNGSVAKELLEAHSEVDQAAKALEKKNAEIAVPLEQSGLELAKEITTNIERWLAGAPDSTKWNMEQPTQDYDVPMADLPEELEDLIGDLLDKEEEMGKDVQDVTSSWLDSMDKGVGWSAADGPISNMSAKGITGNQQPNDQEVGGRSGEGRSGKSSGQMVEESATGKGGKQTPSRSTPDAFEAGHVKDSSKDPTGGSTGGGKTSGVNAEGLRGTPPPPTMEKMDRIKNQQADLRNKAEQLEVSLEKRHYYPEDLKRAIELMRQLEADLARYKGDNYVERRKQIVEKLASLKKVIDTQLRSSRDAAVRLPKELREEILNSLDEEAPEEYKELLKEYYKSLSEGK